MDKIDFRFAVHIARATLLACFLGQSPTLGAEVERVRVAVTVAPQSWLVERIGGDAVDVLIVVGEGESPATFQPTDAQVTALSGVALYFRIGVPAERGPWFRALESHDRIRMVDLRDGLAMRPMEEHHHGGGDHHTHDEHDDDHRHDSRGGHDDHHHHEPGGLDPHIWVSPQRLITMAERVAAELTTVDADRRAVYEKGLAELVTELEALDAELGERLAPLAGTPFFVFHPAWGYFADDYGLRQVAIEIEGKEPSEIELTRLAREARELGVRAIFVQPQITGRSARSIAAAIGAEVITIDPLARDVAENLRRVAERLIGTVPADPQTR